MMSFREKMIISCALSFDLFNLFPHSLSDIKDLIKIYMLLL